MKKKHYIMVLLVLVMIIICLIGKKQDNYEKNVILENVKDAYSLDLPPNIKIVKFIENDKSNKFGAKFKVSNKQFKSIKEDLLINYTCIYNKERDSSYSGFKRHFDIFLEFDIKEENIVLEVSSAEYYKNTIILVTEGTFKYIYITSGQKAESNITITN